MFILHVHDHATKDLKDIFVKDKTTAMQLTAFIEQLKNDQDLLDRLTQNNYGQYETADFHVIQWYEQQHYQNRNLWRVKDWDLISKGLQYRIVYAFTSIKTYTILAVTHRNDLDYNNETDPLTERITSDYDNLL